MPAWVLEFYDHKSFTSQMDDSNKSRHTHAHTHRCTHARAGAHNLDVAWLGVAILSHEHTLLIRNVGHRLPSLPLASFAALIKLVLGCYYACIAWHRLMCVTRRTQYPLPTPLCCCPPGNLSTCQAAVFMSLSHCLLLLRGEAFFKSGPHKKGLRRAR